MSKSFPHVLKTLNIDKHDRWKYNVIMFTDYQTKERRLKIRKGYKKFRSFATIAGWNKKAYITN